MRLILKHDGLAPAATTLVLALVTASAVTAAEDPPPPPTPRKHTVPDQVDNANRPQPAQIVVPEAVLHDARDVMPYLGVELLFVKKVCAPSKEQFRAIRSDLRKLLFRTQRGTVDSSCDRFPQVIADCVARHLSKEQTAKYRAETAKRAVQEREACVDTVVALLDDRLTLTEDQRNALVASLNANWKPAWSQLVEMAIREGGNAIPPLLDGTVIPALDREQIRKWRALPKTDPSLSALHFNGLRAGTVGTPADDTVDANLDGGGS
jgi:hypothetical protein